MIFSLPGLVVRMRKPEIGDLACMAGWLASPSYLANIGGRPGMAWEHYASEARRMLQENADDHAPNKYFIAEDRASGAPVALAILSKIDWKNRHAEFSYIVGAPEFRSTLAAGDLNLVMYNYLFNQLNLHKVYGFVFAPNAASLRMNLFGGSLDGTLRRHRANGEGTMDVHVISILAEEFAAFVRTHAATLMRKHLERGLIQCPA